MERAVQHLVLVVRLHTTDEFATCAVLFRMECAVRVHAVRSGIIVVQKEVARSTPLDTPSSISDLTSTEGLT
ncbi:hypothetical protein KIN20_016770 [Parelaphostrongylus tenuis]|uniref:Uncharacterized protein n=1 Tax=Parelaphostrongylus tenuis TaxID=148309 RepID=A0AAD5MZ34_PARTN|nr:hypothetical protein KIN20_016770 [Parelaphostrongylus tenuis]